MFDCLSLVTKRGQHVNFSGSCSRTMWFPQFSQAPGQVVAPRGRLLISKREHPATITIKLDKPPRRAVLEEIRTGIPLRLVELLRRLAPPPRLKREHKDVRTVENFASFHHSDGVVPIKNNNVRRCRFNGNVRLPLTLLDKHASVDSSIVLSSTALAIDFPVLRFSLHAYLADS